MSEVLLSNLSGTSCGAVDVMKLSSYGGGKATIFTATENSRGVIIHALKSRSELEVFDTNGTVVHVINSVDRTDIHLLIANIRIPPNHGIKVTDDTCIVWEVL